jgi:uncharacterized membrane protein YczE
VDNTLTDESVGGCEVGRSISESLDAPAAADHLMRLLGIGVALLLLAALGSDGYSTFVNGLSLALDVPFVAVNCALGIVLVALAWWRGLVPGLGTVVQPVVVGATVSAVLSMVSAPQALVSRVVALAAAFVILSAGVAGYLGSGTGAGPTEAAALAFDPPIPFRWSYTIV